MEQAGSRPDAVDAGVVKGWPPKVPPNDGDVSLYGLPEHLDRQIEAHHLDAALCQGTAIPARSAPKIYDATPASTEEANRPRSAANSGEARAFRST